MLPKRGEPLRPALSNWLIDSAKFFYAVNAFDAEHPRTVPSLPGSARYREAQA